MRRLVTATGSMAACLLMALYGACGGEDEGTAGAAASGNAAAMGGGGNGVGGLAFGGQTQNGGSGGIQGCNPQTFTLDRGPSPEIYLVIDSSGSMADDGKWDALQDAVDTALTQYDAAIEFGALIYPTDASCATPTAPQVGPPAFGARAAILAALSILPNGGTPTAAALQTAGASLLADGDADQPDFLILATDGGPNCNDTLTSGPCTCSLTNQADCCTLAGYDCSAPDQGELCLDDQGTLDVIADFHGQGIDTFVIGLNGTQSYAEVLDAMAVAGGRPQQGADTQYYNATNPTELEAALQAIVAQTITCTIELAAPPDIPEGVFVYIDGLAIPRDESHQNGWDYTDDTHMTIELYGSYCETLQDGEEHEVTATFPCEVT